MKETISIKVFLADKKRAKKLAPITSMTSFYEQLLAKIEDAKYNEDGTIRFQFKEQ